MSDVKDNVSYIIIPFFLEGKNPVQKLYNNMKSGEVIFERIRMQRGTFCGFIDTLFENVLCGNIRQNETGIDEIRVCLFNTGIGFFSFKYLYSETNYSISDQVQDINSKISDIKQGKFKVLNVLEEKLKIINLFPTGDNRNVVVYNIVISKIGNQRYDLINADAENNYMIDILHECWSASGYVNLISNQHYNNLVARDEDKSLEQNFRDRYEEYLWVMVILLHHERQAYLIYRRDIVLESNNKNRKVKILKKKIIDLLTCYSFKIVSEEADIQKLYSEYRSVLQLSDYEQTLSDLIFRLNDELDKNKEKKITTISLLIAIFGLFQLISVVLDIIMFIASR